MRKEVARQSDIATVDVRGRWALNGRVAKRMIVISTRQQHAVAMRLAGRHYGMGRGSAVLRSDRRRWCASTGRWRGVARARPYHTSAPPLGARNPPTRAHPKGRCDDP